MILNILRLVKLYVYARHVGYSRYRAFEICRDFSKNSN